MQQYGPLNVPAFNDDGSIHMIVESPKGSKAKFKFDAEFGYFRVARALSLGLSYPFDWGFVPSTIAEDGDPVDALLIADFACFPGVVVRCEPLELVEVTQPGVGERTGRRVHNDRIVLVPAQSPRDRSLWARAEVPERVRIELEMFLLNSVVLDKRGVEIGAWQNSEAARALILNSLSP